MFGNQGAAIKRKRRLESTFSSYPRSNLDSDRLSLDGISEYHRLLIDAGRFGENNASQLLSMQYFFLEIALCTNLEIRGSAYGNCADKWVLYSNPDASNLNYETYDSQSAAADVDPTHYIDLMTSQGRTILANKTNQLTKDQVGKTYKYAITTWMKPIKVQAEISYNESLKLCTKGYLPPPAFEPSFENTCPLELGVALASNGGSLMSKLY